MARRIVLPSREEPMDEFDSGCCYAACATKPSQASRCDGEGKLRPRKPEPTRGTTMAARKSIFSFRFHGSGAVSTRAHLNAVVLLECEICLFIHGSRVSTVENHGFRKLRHGPPHPQDEFQQEVRAGPSYRQNYTSQATATWLAPARP